MSDVDNLPPILRFMPPAPDPDALLDAFIDYTASQGLALYEAQEEAILELLADNNVILNTPTGSGKSTVALALHFAALAADKRSIYTAPIKALVSEKFFALCRDFGSDRVGMITGDASVNPDAPILCCTAEILANWALRDGANTDIDVVIMDEFHYYGDPQRGMAWQTPLLELNHCQFLLMSATLGSTEFFERDLTNRTGRETVLVQSAQRPVPLAFEYRRTTIHQSIQDLLKTDRAPIYVVHFTQRDATEAAQGYLSLDPLTKDEKVLVKQAVGSFRFDSPIGKDLRRLVMGGIGVHHAGLLPKYRLLMEKLAQQGLLKIICGTDTLGVGVNVPIRSVLFTQLHKYDGTSTRILTNREFAQIAGRAGRKGFDDEGHVWVQAPAHVVENEIAAGKAATDAKKKKKLVKKKQPDRGYAHWTEDTFTKLMTGKPEAMRSSFNVNHQMIMTLLDRPGDGCGAVKNLLQDNHEPRKRKRQHIRRSISIYRSLLEAELLEVLDEPDDQGRLVRVMLDLQDNFALHQPLSLWAVEAIESIDPEGDTYTLDALTIVESVLESPGVIIAAQVNLAKQELLGELKAAGVEYDERMDRLAEVKPPMPNREWLYDSFDQFRVKHPWVGSDNIKPKSIVREFYEQSMTFKEFIGRYNLKRSEGAVLRYLSDVYKAMIQNIPDDSKTDEIDDLIDWLGVLVRQVDSSLIDEWERLLNPDADLGSADDEAELVAVTTRPRAFRIMVRNEAFRWVQLLARRRYRELATLRDLEPNQRLTKPGLDADALEAAMADYWETYNAIDNGPSARSPEYFSYDVDSGTVTQIIADPDDHFEWRVVGRVNGELSDELGRAVLSIEKIAKL